MGSLKDVGDAWRTTLLNLDTLVAIAWMLMCVFFSDVVAQRERHPPEVVAYNSGEPYWLIDPLMNNKYKPSGQQVVPTSALVAICTLVPLAVIFALSFFDAAALQGAATAARLHGLIYAFSAMDLTINCIKRYCGYWRPYFYDECGFNPSTGNCEGDDYEDAFRSFPSGHSGMSMVCLLYTSYCLLGAARLGRPLRVRGVDVGGPAVFACLLPTALALFIAASRVVDNDHWPADVVGGASIGAAYATLIYTRYFPWVFDTHSHEPRPGFVGCPSAEPSSPTAEDELAVRMGGAA